MACNPAILPIWQLDPPPPQGVPYDLGRVLNNQPISIELQAGTQDLGNGCLLEAVVDPISGSITQINVIARGQNYNAATTTISIVNSVNPAGVTPATARPLIDASGRIYQVLITNPGAGYTNTTTYPTYVSAVNTNNITYSLIGGELPNSLLIDPLRVTSSGRIEGTPAAVTTDTESEFVLRATDLLGNYRDQTFTITVYALNAPTLRFPPNTVIGVLEDSTWTNLQIAYTNPNPLLPVTFSLNSGSLPEGLWLTEDGVINGYARAPGYTYLPSGFTTSTNSTASSRIFLRGDATSTFLPNGYINVNGTEAGVRKINATDPSNINPATGRAYPGVWYDDTTDITTVVFSVGQAATVLMDQEVYTVNPYRITTFAVTVTNAAGLDTKIYQLRINNQAQQPGDLPPRLPVIVNAQPLTRYPEDEYASFYLDGTTEIGRFRQNTFMAFKFIAHDFNGFSVQYQIAGLEQVQGLRLDSNTGWLTGILPSLGSVSERYRIRVRAYTDIAVGQWFSFSFVVTGDINDTIDWITDPLIGTIDNGALSTYAIEASNPDGLELEYLLVGTFEKQFNSSAFLNTRVSVNFNGINTDAVDVNQTRLTTNGSLPSGVRIGMEVRYPSTATWPSAPYPRIVDIDLVGNAQAGYATSVVVDQRIITGIPSALAQCSWDVLSLAGDQGLIVSQQNRSQEFQATNTNNNNNFVGIAADNASPTHRLVAVDDGGRIQTSTDGVTWLYNNTILPSPATRLRWAYNGFYVVGEPYANLNGFNGLLRYSVDGNVWQQIDNDSMGVSVLRDVTADANNIIVVGDYFVDLEGVAYASIYVGTQGSADIQLLDSADLPQISKNLYSVATGTAGAATIYMAVGQDGTILVSDNAVAWQSTPITGFTEDLSAVTFDGTRFVIVGSNGAVITATVSMTPSFSIINTGYTYDFTDVAYYAVAPTPTSSAAIGYVLTAELGIALMGTDLANLSNPLVPSLPPNLNLTTTGDLSGKVAFETQSSMTTQARTVGFTFTVQASSVAYPNVTADRQFTLNVYQRWSRPYENLYMRAFLPLEDRDKLSALLDDTGVVAVEVANPGRGYATPPLVTIAPPGLAVAKAVLNNSGDVVNILLEQPGYDYSTTDLPVITIDPPYSDAKLWLASDAEISVDQIIYYRDPTIQQTNFYRITAVAAGGSFGTSPPTFTYGYMPNGDATLEYIGAQAEASATVDQTTGRIRTIVVTKSGNKYPRVPQVIISAPPLAQTATAVASITLGEVTGITVTNPGSGYRSEPVVTIEPSPIGAAYDATATSVMYMPEDTIYRPGDQYFGKATGIVYQHQFGVWASSYQEYIDSVDKNFYNRRLVLGELATATATDSAGKIIYEVVYSNIVDDLTLNNRSVSKELTYPRPIPLSNTPWFVANSTLFSSYGIVPSFRGDIEITAGASNAAFVVRTGNRGSIQVGYFVSGLLDNNGVDNSLVQVTAYDPATGIGALNYNYSGTHTVVIGEKLYFTALSPGYTDRLYPASLTNMRSQINDTIGQNPASSILPLWMTSQQASGSALGFVNAWVICYAKPGYGQEVKRTIEQYYPYKLNSLDFQIDRFEVDKSTTYNYYASSPDVEPIWHSFPSADPAPDPTDSQDWFVFFPRKTILG